MKKFLTLFVPVLLFAFAGNNTATAQQYKLRQVTTVMGMKTESTIYVKGMRKRTEAGSMMGMPAPPISIEQCDLQRTIKLNDKKKLYFIIPFSKDEEEVIDEDLKPTAQKNKPTPSKSTTQKGGTITLWYNITDTGERKKMFGFTARHVWTTQKIKPSPDACSMKDSIIIKTDGWYIDLPQFNCPVRYKPQQMGRPGEMTKPDCMDKFVARRSGKGKLGFPITEITTIIMGNSGPKTTQFETNIETLEFSAAKLDSMLFEIPPGYTQAASEEELQEKIDLGDMMKQAKNGNFGQLQQPPVNEQKTAGVIRVGIYPPQGDAQVQPGDLQQYLVGTFTDGKVEAVAVSSEEDAKKYNCDYTLKTEFTKVKQGSKVGGLLKAIKNTDPNAASSFNIDATMTLTRRSDGSVHTQQNISGKYEGKIDDAAKKALDDGSRQVLKTLK